MKQLILLISSIWLFAGCDKTKEESALVFSLNKEGTLINTDTILARPKDSSISYYIDVNYSSGKKTAVELEIRGLPTFVTATLNPQIGTPPFKSRIDFQVNYMSPKGKFPLQIIGTSLFSRREVYELILQIDKYDCPNMLYGGYLAQSNFTTRAGSYHKCDITPTMGNVGIYLNGFIPFDSTIRIFASIDCKKNEIVIPEQTVFPPGLTFKGAGSFDEDSIKIHYTIKESGDSCNVTMRR